MADADVAHWVEVSLTVNGELAEAVAEVFDRFSSNGVVVEVVWFITTRRTKAPRLAR